jgi:hypothetical protein
VVFVALNFGLYEVQEWWYADDVKRCEEMKRELDAMQAELESMARTVSSSAGVERYDALVRSYNERVEEYNSLASVAYRRWYLIPRGGGRSATARPRLGS